MKLYEGIKLDIGYTKEDLKKALAKSLKINCQDITNIEIIKESIDARRKPNVYNIVNVAFDCSKKNKEWAKLKDIEVSHAGIKETKHIYNGVSPVVVGFGPSGMFMALKLAKSGYKPIVIEMGDTVEDRLSKVETFWKTGKLDIYSNVHFGEGGAGTFSDGKLNSNISNEYCKLVTNELILNGANEEIFYKSKPHIGTDNLQKIVKSIRQQIIRLGGKVIFNTKLIDILIEANKIKGVLVRDLKESREYSITTDALILAIGHSAKDTFRLIKNKGVDMEQKPFAMGVRIEQKQEDINMAQYGKLDSKLPAADYKLAVHLSSGRSVFTFCMCPGGVVVASSSEENTIVTNGMSYFARDKENANSAILVNVTPEDFPSDDVLAGFELQEEYERKAFELGGGNYEAPAISVGEFLTGKKHETINPTYRPNVRWVDISKCLPDFVTNSIKEALPLFEKKIKNFAKTSNILTAIESKSSCPVKVVRQENNQTNILGLFAIGEGAGYAGGIMSSAQDGLKVAESVIEYLKKL